MADEVDALVASRARRAGLAARRRYSPGYGDFPLAAQRDFAALLDFDRLGIAVTPECLLRPAKSVTAAIALAEPT
jgi:cobalamin-dependent methionine synthase I